MHFNSHVFKISLKLENWSEGATMLFSSLDVLKYKTVFYEKSSIFHKRFKKKKLQKDHKSCKHINTLVFPSGET